MLKIFRLSRALVILFALPCVWAGGSVESLSRKPGPDRNAEAPQVVDPLIATGVAKLTLPDAAQTDRFGVSVSIDGDMLVVGTSPVDEVVSKSAFVYERDAGSELGWTQVASLIAHDSAADDGYGFSVAISGDKAILGAPADDGAGPASGSVYVYERNAGGLNRWGEVAKLMASDEAVGDEFGFSVSISDDVFVVGAPADDEAGLDAGAAYVFRQDAGGPDPWVEVAKLTAADAAPEDQFGYSVSISGDTIVVGVFAQDGAALVPGAAYVFERDAGGTDNWGQVKKLIASDGGSRDSFGRSLSIDGDTVVVGAFRHDTAVSNSGAAYVFQRNEGGADNWGQASKLTASDATINDEFGNSVSIDGDIVVIGASRDSDGLYNYMGSAYFYERDSGGPGAWGQAAKLIAPDGVPGDSFGSSVSISGDSTVIGAPGDDGLAHTAGSAYVFTLFSDPCGDGLQEPGEECDDGNPVDGDGCDSNCTFTACGNGVVTGGEACDDGNPTNGDGCDFDCTVTACGNGILTAPEVCDDGNAVDDDGCSSQCAREAVIPNALANGDFQTGSLPPWIWFTNGVATTQVVDGAAQVVLTTTGSNAQLFQRDIGVVGGRTYRLIFDGSCQNDGQACAGSDADLNVRLLRDSGAPLIYGLNWNVSLTPWLRTHATDFLAPPGIGSVDDGRFRFWFVGFGSPGNIYTLDNVYLARLPTCGDGVLDAGEICDDGNSVNGDGCEANCRLCVDLDGDGHGAPASPGCPAGITEDCDDSDPTTYPGAPQRCDGLNNDCDEAGWPEVAPEEFDNDGDGALACTDCDDNAASTYPGASQLCDGLNNDCTHAAWPGLDGTNEVDNDGDGSSACDGDCDDSDPGVHPGAVDVCNGEDDDCDGLADFHDIADCLSQGQRTTLVAADGAEFDDFGEAVALDADTLVVGAPNDRDAGPASGSAYVFERSAPGEEDWIETAKLTASDGSERALFGMSVSVSDDTIVVGAGSDDGNGPNAGSAYVFERNAGGAGQWGEVARLTPDDAAAEDRFGWSVAIYGDTIIAGATRADGVAPETGAAYVFQRNAAVAHQWDPVGKLTVLDGQTGDRFGTAVAMGSGVLVVGAPFDHNPDLDTGSVHVFLRDGAQGWVRADKLRGSDSRRDDWFGEAVSIGGDTIVVGARFHDHPEDRSGAAYVFDRVGVTDQWVQVVELTAYDGSATDYYGSAVSIAGDAVVVGSDLSAFRRGSTYLYKRNVGGADGWGFVAKLVATDAENGDHLGESVVTDGETVFAGAHADGDVGSFHSGSLYIFDAGCTTCGDGSVQPCEECDDGNALPDDGCNDECLFECEDQDGDGAGTNTSTLCLLAGVDCDDANPTTYPGAPQTCDGVNNDCDDSTWPVVPPDEVDGDQDGVRICDNDCNDSDALIQPAAPEICNGVDDNCDGLVDEDELGEDTDGDGVHNRCDNCRNAANPTQEDADGDLAGDPCDNCLSDFNPSQEDLDADDHGDLCDNCPTTSNVSQGDQDADSVGDACDNCPLDPNRGQSDADGDLEGDHCDLNDGLIHVFTSSPDFVEWQEETGFEAWNAYRGDLAALEATSVYTQPIDSGGTLANQECDLSQPFVQDLVVLAGGQVAYYLVTGVAETLESSLGVDGNGQVRPNHNPCP